MTYLRYCIVTYTHHPLPHINKASFLQVYSKFSKLKAASGRCHKAYFPITQTSIPVSLVLPVKRRDSSVSIATDYGLDDRMIGVRIPAGPGKFSLRHRVELPTAEFVFQEPRMWTRD
jgi:hypothetical protein